MADGLPPGLDQPAPRNAAGTYPAHRRPASDRTWRLRALGNAVVPQVAEALGRMIIAALEAGRC